MWWVVPIMFIVIGYGMWKGIQSDNLIEYQLGMYCFFLMILFAIMYSIGFIVQ